MTTDDPTEDDYEGVNAERESPNTHPNDHIDVALDCPGGGRRILRFDVAGDDVARYRYEIVYDDITLNTPDAAKRAAARYLYEEHDIDAEVTVEAPDLAEGVCRSKHISEV